MELEEEFEVTISDDIAEQNQTFEDLMRWIIDHRKDEP